jgi:hypothetical protein
MASSGSDRSSLPSEDDDEDVKGRKLSSDGNELDKSEVKKVKFSSFDVWMEYRLNIISNTILILCRNLKYCYFNLKKKYHLEVKLGMLRVKAQDLNRRESPCNLHLIRAMVYHLLKQKLQSSDLSKLNSPHFNREDSAAVFLITRV